MRATRRAADGAETGCTCVLAPVAWSSSWVDFVDDMVLPKHSGALTRQPDKTQMVYQNGCQLAMAMRRAVSRRKGPGQDEHEQGHLPPDATGTEPRIRGARRGHHWIGHRQQHR